MDFRLKLKNLVKSPSEHLSPSHHSSSQRHALHLNSISGRILSDSTPTKSEADPTTERLVRVLRVYQKQKEARQLNQNPDDTDPLLQAELEQSIDRSFLNEPACFSSVHTSTVSQEHDTTPTERQTCFDGGSYVLQRLPLNLDSGFLMHEKQRYERQLRVVSRKVCDLATKRKDQLETQLSKVIELQRKVAQADHVCSEGRAHLKQCKSKLSDPGLLVLAKKQKRDRVQRLLEQLLVIRRLRETERVLANLLRSDDKLPQAVRISINCEREARALESFQCVSLIPDRLHRITQLLEQQAADALGRQCLHFCPNSYARILRALELLNRSQTILDLILLHSTDALHDRACSVLIGYVQLMNLPQQSESGSLEPLRKKPFDQLCHLLPIDVLLPCLADLGRTCYELLLNYRRIAAWHQQQLRLLEKEPSNETADDEDVVTKIVNIDDLLIDADHDYNKNNDYEHANNCMDSNWICRLDRTLVDQKLTHAARRLWHETQRKWITLLTGHDLSSLSFDQLLIILRLMRKAQQLGAEFCGSESSELEEAISRLASNYLLSFHRSKMDELRLYLDMEEWVRFPVRNSFSIDQLHEFKSLHEKRRSAAQFHSSIASSRDCDQYFTVEIIESNDSKFENPFELSSDDSPDTSFLITDECSSPGSASELSDDENHELAVPTVDATTDSSTESRRHSPIVSNSTLGLSRLLGKYLQAMCMLEPLAFDVLLCAFQLLDMYIFGVYSFFASTSSSMLNTSSTVTLADTNSLDVLIPGQLKNVIDRIEKSLLFPDQDGKTVTNDSPKKIRYCRPKLNPAVILSEPTNLFGLPQRIVAVESL